MTMTRNTFTLFVALSFGAFTLAACMQGGGSGRVYPKHQYSAFWRYSDIDRPVIVVPPGPEWPEGPEPELPIAPEPPIAVPYPEPDFGGGYGGGFGGDFGGGDFGGGDFGGGDF